MMISPNAYVDQYQDYKYKDLLKVRDELMEYIVEFENSEKEEPTMYPTPETIYQCNLEYMAELCKLIQQKYNEEYVD